MINNSLFWSNDPNYVLQSSVEVQKDTDDNHLIDFATKIQANATTVNRSAGRKLVLAYGTTLLPKFNSLFPNGSRSFQSALKEVLGLNYSVAQLPAEITPAGVNGWITVNLDQVKMHYTSLPSLKAQGSNDEKMYYWFNFLMGSVMLEVLTSGGIVRQPATFEA
jgi:hypothetical protein